MGTRLRLQSRCFERVARLQRAVVETLLEPARALCGRAVRPGLRAHGASGLFLDVIVADCGRSAERFLYVTRIQDLPLARGARPDAGKAVRLQLEAHAQTARAELLRSPGTLDL